MTALWTIKQAAEHLGLPATALERVAARNGFIIMVGSAKRIRPEELEELIETCRQGQKVRGSTGGNEKTGAASGTSETDQHSARPAQTAAAMLKKRSRDTLQKSTGRLVPLSQAN